jgi:hypothetical protein
LTPQENRFAIAKEFYARTFAPSVVKAIDMNGTPEAMRRDPAVASTLPLLAAPAPARR